MIKKIILCADDFGYNSAVSSGIINLLNLGSINATSCLVNMPASQKEILRLSSLLTTNIDIGLHLNFTEGKALTNCSTITDSNNNFRDLNTILIKSHLRKLKFHEIYLEVKAQIELFMQYHQRKPDFIDGHQHVHQFPIIRTALFKAYGELNLRQNNTYIRSVNNMKGRTSLKTKIIQLAGATQLHTQAIKLSIPTNTNFSGAYNFSKVKQYKNIIINAYKNIKDKGLIMCHPGLNSKAPDLLKSSRQIEYAYFSSKEALNDLKDNNIKLCRGREIL